MLVHIVIVLIFFFFSFASTLGFQFLLRIWWSFVGHPWVHKASPGVLLVMTISLLTRHDGSCMSVKCGRYLALPLHSSTSGMVWFSWLCSDVGWAVVSCPQSKDGSLVRSLSINIISFPSNIDRLKVNFNEMLPLFIH